MKIEKLSSTRSALLTLLAAQFIWGTLPVYWKSLQGVPVDQILANRIIWSWLLVMLYLLFGQRRKDIFKNIFRKENWRFFILGIILSSNWLIYVHAIHIEEILQGSLGYYICPLLTVFLARVLLKERLDMLQAAAVALGVVAVTILTVSYGRVPLIALVVAGTFAIYGLIKKQVAHDAAYGFFLELTVVFPFAVAYLLYLALGQGEALYAGQSALENTLLVGTGLITALPLILFAYGVQRMPLVTSGFLQYLSPSMTLVIGLCYGEVFSTAHLITFGLIWVALLIFSYSQARLHRRHTRKR